MELLTGETYTYSTVASSISDMPTTPLDCRVPLLPTVPSNVPERQHISSKSPLSSTPETRKFQAPDAKKGRQRFELRQKAHKDVSEARKPALPPARNSRSRFANIINKLEKFQSKNDKISASSSANELRHHLLQVDPNQLADTIFQVALHVRKSSKTTQATVFDSILEVLNQLDSNDEKRVVEGAADWIERMGSVDAIGTTALGEPAEQTNEWKDGMSSLSRYLSHATVRYIKNATPASSAERLHPQMPADCMMHLIVAIDAHLAHINEGTSPREQSPIARQLGQIHNECIQQLLEYRLSFNAVAHTLRQVANELEESAPELSRLAQTLKKSMPSHRQTLQFAAPVFERFMLILDEFIAIAEEENDPELADLKDLEQKLLEIEREGPKKIGHFLLDLKELLGNDDFRDTFNDLPKLRLINAAPDLVTAAHELDIEGALGLAEAAEATAEKLPSLAWAPSLNASPHMRAYESQLADYAKDHLSSGLVHAADALADVLHSHLHELDDAVLVGVLGYIHEKSGAWIERVPELRALVEANTSLERKNALQTFFLKPDKSGWHHLAMPFVLSKVTIHFQNTDILPWDEITFTRHEFIAYERDRVRIGPRQKFVAPVSGIISRHDPDSSVDPVVNNTVRPLDGFKPDLMNAKFLTLKSLRQGMPYGGSVAGHTNMSLSVADYIRQNGIGETDTKHIFLLSLLSGVASGSHPFNEGLLAGYFYLWYGARVGEDIDEELAQILSSQKELAQIESNPGEQEDDVDTLERFLSSFDGTKLIRFFSSFDGTETGLMLDQGRQFALEKAKQTFRENSHFRQPPSVQPMTGRV